MVEKLKKELKQYLSPSRGTQRQSTIIDPLQQQQSQQPEKKAKTKQFHLDLLGSGGSVLREHLKLTQSSDKPPSDLIIIDLKAGSVELIEHSSIPESTSNTAKQALDLQSKLNNFP